MRFSCSVLSSVDRSRNRTFISVVDRFIADDSSRNKARENRGHRFDSIDLGRGPWKRLSYKIPILLLCFGEISLRKVGNDIRPDYCKSIVSKEKIEGPGKDRRIRWPEIPIHLTNLFAWPPQSPCAFGQGDQDC
jgi:hypothetical protein